MNGLFDADKYRTTLGDGNNRQFAIVIVQATGGISWSFISEQEFNMADCDDLPEHLLDQVATAYEHLKSLDDGAGPGDAIADDVIKRGV